jgi:hypothetical protein
VRPHHSNYDLSDQNGKVWVAMVMKADGLNPQDREHQRWSDPVRGWPYHRIAVMWNR